MRDRALPGPSSFWLWVEDSGWLPLPASRSDLLRSCSSPFQGEHGRLFFQEGVPFSRFAIDHPRFTDSPTPFRASFPQTTPVESSTHKGCLAHERHSPLSPFSCPAARTIAPSLRARGDDDDEFFPDAWKRSASLDRIRENGPWSEREPLPSRIHANGHALVPADHIRRGDDRLVRDRRVGRDGAGPGSSRVTSRTPTRTGRPRP